MIGTDPSARGEPSTRVLVRRYAGPPSASPWSMPDESGSDQYRPPPLAGRLEPFQVQEARLIGWRIDRSETDEFVTARSVLREERS
jgi:hypothetical protein